MEKQYNFKKGQVVHLDDVYEILSLIPDNAIKTKDIADYNMYNECDYDENVEFLKNVSIEIKIKIGG